MGATGKFYGMSNDYMFRAVLQESEDTLKHLVGTLMHMKVSDIKECRIINPIILGKKIGAKDTVMDVRLDLTQIGNAEQDGGTDPELIKWAKIFKAEFLQELEALAGDDEALKEMVTKAKELSKEEEIELQCEARMIHEWNVQAERQAGIEQKTIQVYRDCLDRGMSEEEARSISGITEEMLATLTR